MSAFSVLWEVSEEFGGIRVLQTAGFDVSAVPRVGRWVCLRCSDFISSAVAVWHEQQTLLPGGALQFSGLFFLHFLQGEKYPTGFFGSFFITCSSHMGGWELMFHRLKTLSLRIFCKFSGRSFAAGHRPLGRGNVAVGLFCVVFILGWKLLALVVIWLTAYSEHKCCRWCWLTSVVQIYQPCPILHSWCQQSVRHKNAKSSPF